MSVDTDTILERRRLRRRVTFWRAGAIIALIVALGVVYLQGDATASFGQPQIARVAFEGTIVDDRNTVALIKKLGEEDHVQALLLFINSPGGTTTGGESIFEAVRKVAAVKPVVAQFSTLATSAGYIVGLSADHIVSRGNTITGSVGVLLQWPQLTELMDKVGIQVNTIRSGTLKATPNPFEPTDERARQVAQEIVDDSFQWFISLVEKRRGVQASHVPGLVEGGIFSGRDALSYRLVDELGGEAEAIRWLEVKRGVAKDLKVVDRYPVSDKLFGFSGWSQALARILGADMGGVASVLVEKSGLDRLSLDGLVSVWHPPEN